MTAVAMLCLVSGVLAILMLLMTFVMAGFHDVQLSEVFGFFLPGMVMFGGLGALEIYAGLQVFEGRSRGRRIALTVAIVGLVSTVLVVAISLAPGDGLRLNLLGAAIPLVLDGFTVWALQRHADYFQPLG